MMRFANSRMPLLHNHHVHCVYIVEGKEFWYFFLTNWSTELRHGIINLRLTFCSILKPVWKREVYWHLCIASWISLDHSSPTSKKCRLQFLYFLVKKGKRLECRVVRCMVKFRRFANVLRMWKTPVSYFCNKIRACSSDISLIGHYNIWLVCD